MKKKLRSVFCRYDALSVSKAIYAITSWIPNRRYIGVVDVINREFLVFEALSSYGTKNILSYEEFQLFFYDIYNIVNEYMSYSEDFTPDTGEVMFCYEEKFYKIFIANGSENIYEHCFLIGSIIEKSKKFKSIWNEILSYENDLILCIYDKEWRYSNMFEIPPLEYFEMIKSKYLSFQNTSLATFFRGFKSNNEELYDFFSKNNQYPIFLPQIKEVFLEMVEQKLNYSEYKKATWEALIQCLRNNFYLLDSTQKCTLFPIGYRKNSNKGEFKLENSFILIGDEKCVIFYSEDLANVFDQETQKYLIDGQYSFFGLTIDGKTVGLNIPSSKSIIFQKIIDSESSPSITKTSFLMNEDTYITSADLIGITNFSSNIEEIIEFIYYMNKKSSEEKMICFSGTLSVFQVWQDVSKVIVEGANSPTIVLPSYQSVEKTVDFFKGLNNYPFDSKTLFFEIHSWNKMEDTKADLSLASKDNSGSAEIFVFGRKKIIYCVHHFISEDISVGMLEGIGVINEVIENALYEYKELILSKYSGINLEINVVSENIVEKNAKDLLIICSQYCRKTFFYKDSNNLVVLLSPYWEKILEDSIQCNTKKFENELILSFLDGVPLKDIKEIKKTIEDSNNLKRTSIITSLSIKYFVDVTSTFHIPKLVALKNVRKLMSMIIKKIELPPGKYKEESILGTVRQFRNEIRNELVQKIRKFDNTDLHIKLLNIYASILFQINIQQERLNQFSEEINLQEDVILNFKQKAIELREEYKTYKIVLEYLMEENIIAEQSSDSLSINENEIEEIVAFAKWIIDFQSLSDGVSYGAIGWRNLIIREDYILEIEETEKFISNSKETRHLRYEFGDYCLRNKEIDKEMFEETQQAFKKDTKISFKSMQTTLNLLSSYTYISEFIELDDVVVNNNVIEAPISSVAKMFIDETLLPLEDFYACLKFLTIQKDKIVDKNGNIPIWEHKKRRHKLVAQPILVYQNKMIFSPIMLSELDRNWCSGMMNFILPYNYGMDKTSEVIKKWKKKYEAKIVSDLATQFAVMKHITHIDKEIYKLDSKGNHPRNLGDYDLIVIDERRNVVLLFEIKYMRLSQTMKDWLGDQAEYFTKKAKADKFEKRVEYFQNNISAIMKNLGYENEFMLESYFLTNKNIRSYFKSYSSFEIIGYNEFVSNHFKKDK